MVTHDFAIGLGKEKILKRLQGPLKVCIEQLYLLRPQAEAPMPAGSWKELSWLTSQSQASFQALLTSTLRQDLYPKACSQRGESLLREKAVPVHRGWQSHQCRKVRLQANACFLVIRLTILKIRMTYLWVQE